MVELLFDSSSYVLNIYGFPHLFTAVFLQTLALSILISENGSTLGFLFAFMTTIACTWLFFVSLLLLSNHEFVARVWSHLLLFCVCYIPFSLYLYVANVTDTLERNEFYLLLSFLVSLALSLFALFSDRMIVGIQQYWWGFYPQYGLYSFMFIVYHGIVQTWCLVLLWSKWRSAGTEIRRRRFGFFLLAFVSASFAPIDLFGAYGYDIYPAGFLTVIGFCSIISFTIVRYRTTNFSAAYAAEEMMATMDDPLIVCDLEGNIKLVNDRCREVFEFEEENLVGHSFQKLLASSELGSGKITALQRGKIPENEEFLFRTRSGEEVDVNLSVSRLTDSQDRPVGTVMIARDIREEKKAKEQIERLAYHDDVTELPNRRYLYEEFDEIVEAIDSDREAFLYIGVPEFEEIKRSIGPQDTERLLKKITERLESIVGESDLVVNWNEHEFLLILPALSERQEAIDLAERWLEELNDPFRIDSTTFTIRSNIGIAFRPEEGSDLEELVTKADLARNEVRKEAGKNILVYEEGIREETARRIDVKNNLRQAVNEQMLDIVYHPIFPVDTDQDVLLEALLRWEDDTHGSISPPKIIRMAEELNLMSQLGHWIITQGARDLARINDALDISCRLSLNLSASQLHQQGDLLDSIDQQLDNNTTRPENLMFEITETTAVQDLDFSRGVLASIRDRGCAIAVDDFGTGHSSIQYLMDLPVDTLKIDKSFILNLFERTKNKILVETMLFMAHQLGYDVIAEGVENERQRDFLIDNNCNYLQGFLWTRPLKVEDCIIHLGKEGADPRRPGT